jgi:hypothetical protein
VAALLAVYGYGIAVALYVHLCRASGRLITPAAFATIFLHVPSRRNGIPWLVKAVAKAFGWPVVLATWLANGRPPSPVLVGPAAAIRLGIDPDSLGYLTNGFATMWRESS